MAFAGKLTIQSAGAAVDRDQFPELNGAPVEWDFKNVYTKYEETLYPDRLHPFKVLMARRNEPKVFTSSAGGRFCNEMYTLNLLIVTGEEEDGTPKAGLITVNIGGRRLDPDTFAPILDKEGKYSCKREFMEACYVFESQNDKAFETRVPDAYNKLFMPQLVNLRGRICIATVGFRGEYPIYRFRFYDVKGRSPAEIRDGVEEPRQYKADCKEFLETQAQAVIDGALTIYGEMPEFLKRRIDAMSGNSQPISGGVPVMEDISTEPAPAVKPARGKRKQEKAGTVPVGDDDIPF